MNRLLPIVIVVLGFHALGLWVLGRAGKPATVDPESAKRIMVEWIREAPAAATWSDTLQAPKPAIPPAPQRIAGPLSLPASRATPEPQVPASSSEPVPEPVPDPATTRTSEEALATPAAPYALTPPSGSVAGIGAEPSALVNTSASTAPARVDQPSSSARHLNNPPPPYPPLSKRLGEQGEVVVRALIETNGMASRAEISHSSGFERLDQVALQTVLRWRYVPGKRNGMTEAMWFNVPIQFVLK